MSPLGKSRNYFEQNKKTSELLTPSVDKFRLYNMQKRKVFADIVLRTKNEEKDRQSSAVLTLFSLAVG
jgi:hypothetical protein